MKLKRRHGEFKQGCVLSQRLPATDSCADTLSLPLLPGCVFVIRETVRHPRRFLLGKSVREPNCSWTGAFVNRGPTVQENTKLGYVRRATVTSVVTSHIPAELSAGGSQDQIDGWKWSVQLLTATGTTGRPTSDVNCPTDRFTTSVLKVSRSCLAWTGGLVCVALTDNISFFFSVLRISP
jgi:hypothetical protein